MKHTRVLIGLAALVIYLGLYVWLSLSGLWGRAVAAVLLAIMLLIVLFTGLNSDKQ